MDGNVEIRDVGVAHRIEKDVIRFQVSTGTHIRERSTPARWDVHTDELFFVCAGTRARRRVPPSKTLRQSPGCIAISLNGLLRCQYVVTDTSAVVPTAEVSSEHQIEDEEAVLVVLECIAQVNNKRMVNLPR